MNRRNILVCLLALCVLWGCAGHAPRHAIVVQAHPQANPWTHLDLKNDPNCFQFAIVADRTGGQRPGVFEDAMEKLNLLQPEFVMCVGDLIEGKTEDRAQVNREWNELVGFVERLEMPFFFVLGNHDLSNDVMVDVWRERFGRPYYHFVYRDVLFLCLDTEDPPASHMSEAQAEYVADALAENPDVRWTLVFMHKPLWEGEEQRGWEKIEALLDGRDYTVFAGHHHTYLKSERLGRRYILLSTTGGSSSLEGPAAGQFDHVVWVTMTQDGPRLANLMLDGIWDENIRTEETAALAEQAS